MLFHIHKTWQRFVMKHVSLLSSLQSLADQEAHLKRQIKELEANVLAAAPDKAKQKQKEESLNEFKKGRLLLSSHDICLNEWRQHVQMEFLFLALISK